MKHGYQPQTTYISKALYWTFFLGVFLGTVLGFSIRPLFGGDGNRSEDEMVATNTAAKESVPPPAPDSAESATAPVESQKSVSQESVPAPAVPETIPAASFDPEVEGLWPARHIFVGVEGSKVSLETQEWLNEFKPGGVLLGPENIVDPIQLSTLVLQIKQAVGLGTKIDDPPVIIYQDESRPLPAIATTLEMADADMDSNPIAAVLAQARAARAHGIGVFLAPPLDIYLPGLSAPSLKNTVLGRQPGEVSRIGLDYIRQLRSGGVLPVATHFPGAGLAVSAEDGVWHIPADQMDGMAAGMQPFREAIAVEIPGLLVGHMAVPGIDPEAPNRPASSSPKLLKILLREKLKFTGVVIADDLGKMPGIDSVRLDRVAISALVNGCDAVILKAASREKMYQICAALVRLSERRDFPAAQLATSRKRLDAWQTQLAETSPPLEPAPPETKPIQVAATKPPETTATAASAPATPKDTLRSGSELPPEKDTPEALPLPEALPESDAVPTAEEGVAIEAPGTSAPVEVSPSEKMSKTTPAQKPDTAPENNLPPEDTSVEKISETATAPEVAADTKSSPAEDVLSGQEDTLDNSIMEGPFLEHKIEKGDSLIALAAKYGVRVADLMAWNKLDSQKIKYGFKLKVRPLKKESAGGTKADGNDGGGEEDISRMTETSQPADEHSPEEDPAISSTGSEKFAGGETPRTAAPPAEDTRSVESPTTSEEPESVTTPVANPVASEKTGNAPKADTAITTEAKDDVVLTGSAPAEESEPSEKASGITKIARVPQPPDTEKRSHECKAGETLGSVAAEYGIDMKELAAWNGLDASELPLIAGTSLVVYLPVATAEETEEEASTTKSGTYKIHVVVPGDNLRRIAKKYGVTQQALIDLNNIKRPDHVQLGWKLKIPN